jgi:hypothetical protein
MIGIYKILLIFSKPSIHFKCKQGEDKMLWRLYKDVRFNVWSFYEMMRGTNCFDFPWKAIWQVKVPTKIAFFRVVCELEENPYYR